jgi:hypothetical protein
MLVFVEDSQNSNDFQKTYHRIHKIELNGLFKPNLI